MHGRPPTGWWQSRRARVAGVMALVGAVALAMALATPAGRAAVRTFAVRAWHVPIPGSESTPSRPASASRAGGVPSSSGTASGTATVGPQWTPPVGASWQWLPLGTPAAAYPVDVYDLPLATTSAATVAGIHARGGRAVCWMPVGIVLANDPRLAAIDPTLLGKAVPGHPDERFLDLRRVNDLMPLLTSQLDECQLKGFDGVDAAALDTYLTAGPGGTGFTMGYPDELAVVQALSGLAHARGLALGVHAVGTTRDTAASVEQLEPVSDFALVERCGISTVGCHGFARYGQRGKAVLHLEYLTDYTGASVTTPQAALGQACRAVAGMGYSTIVKDGSGRYPSWRVACP